MAKRSNNNPRKKNIDPYEDRTIIKISSPKKDTGNKKPSRTKSNNSKNSKPEPKKPNRQNTRKPKQETTNKTQKRSTKKVSEKPKENTQNKPTTSSTSKPVTPTPVVNNDSIKISQSVAILIDGNNIEMSLTKLTNNKSAVLNYDTFIPKILNGRGLNRLIYFREGISISKKLADRLHTHYFGSVVPCHKSADIPLSINATQLADKVDTIIILSGDSDYVELVRHLKSKGVRVEIAAIEITTANILIEEADYYNPITKADAFILK